MLPYIRHNNVKSAFCNEKKSSKIEETKENTLCVSVCLFSSVFLVLFCSTVLEKWPLVHHLSPQPYRLQPHFLLLSSTPELRYRWQPNQLHLCPVISAQQIEAAGPPMFCEAAGPPMIRDSNMCLQSVDQLHYPALLSVCCLPLSESFNLWYHMEQTTTLLVLSILPHFAYSFTYLFIYFMLCVFVSFVFHLDFIFTSFFFCFCCCMMRLYINISHLHIYIILFIPL